ncbi:putative component of type VI protein secretion system [Natronospira proteinivora]|uniref:Component of type VI protein secretion system n=1 Tax=Natronospira proteinivora TaxID=1807133 RepID=A0ABT1G4U8_9GAMM|nr:FHA domain-containing protein [Natronospira proteinivora]MCP1726320.1 putative component of type VI protein secretion system [Natronospira proteinivora]
MAKLSVFYRGKLYSEFEIKKRATLGRQKDNDIHLDESTVSGHHARVVIRDDHFCVEDLESTNGTYLGDRRIRRVGLRNGDAFHIGPFQVRFSGPSAPPSFQDTMILHLDDIKDSRSDVDQVMAEVADDPIDDGKESRIEVLNGNNAGEALVLEEAITTVGVRGKQVAAVTRRRDGFYLVPVAGGSPRINGRENGPASVRLNDGDELEVAGVRLAFRQNPV